MGTGSSVQQPLGGLRIVGASDIRTIGRRATRPIIAGILAEQSKRYAMTVLLLLGVTLVFV